MNRKIERCSSYEPFFYMAFVLKGTEQQYLDLLKYIEKENNAQLIYQCRSLTYLHISKEEPQNRKTALSGLSLETSAEPSHGGCE